MTKEPKDKTEEKKSNASESSLCMYMMANMMGQSGEGVSCNTIINQFLSTEDIPEDWLKEMSKMGGSMGSCCGSKPADGTEDSQEA